MARRRDAVVRRGSPPRRPGHRRAAGHVRPRRPGQQPLRRHDRGQRLRHRRDHRPGAAAVLRRRAPPPRRRWRSPSPRSSSSPLLKIVGILGRRLFAGIMSYRLQADYRRRVTRQYLRLPLSWHQQHPTGQLLSNANSDVEATWFFVAPLPFACGALVMIAITVVALVAHRPAAGPRRAGRLPAGVRRQRRLLAGHEPAHAAGPAAARRGQRDRARELRRRARRQDAGPRGVGDRALRRPRRGAARRADRGRPGARAVRPADGGAAQPRHARRAADRCRPGRRRQHRRRRASSPSPTCSRCSRCPSGRSAGCSPTCRARWPASTGSPRSSRRPARRRTARTPRPRATAAPRWACAGVGFTFDGDDAPDAARGHLRRHRPAAPSPSSARPARASPPSPGCWSASSTPPTARSCSTASTCAACGRARSAARPPSSPRAPSSSTTPSAATSPSAPTFTDDEVWAALRVAAADDFVAALPDGLDTRVGERGATLSGGQRQRLALARAVVRRPRLLVLDDATSAVDPSVEARILDALRDERATPRPWWSSPTGRPPSRSPTRWSGSSTARRSRAARTSELLAEVPGYADLVRAYSQARGGGMTRRDADRRGRPPRGGRPHDPAPGPADDARVPPRAAGDLRARPGRHRRPGRRADRRPAGHRPRAWPRADRTWPVT